MKKNVEPTTEQEPSGGFLEKLKPGDAIVAELKKLYGDPVQIATDEKALDAAIKAVAKARTGIEATRKDVIKQVVAVQKAINAEAGRLTEEIHAIEMPLLSEKKKIVDARIAEEEKAKAAALKLFNDRTSKLFEAGFTFDGVNYCAGLVFVSAKEIPELDEADFELHLESGRQAASEQRRLLDLAKQLESPTKPPEMDPGLEITLDVHEQETNPSGVGLPLSDWLSDGGPKKLAGVMDLPFGDPLDQVPVQPDAFAFDHDLNRVFGDSPEGYRPPGYNMGFAACQNAVVELLENSPAMKRSELIEKVKSLKI